MSTAVRRPVIAGLLTLGIAGAGLTYAALTGSPAVAVDRSSDRPGLIDHFAVFQRAAPLPDAGDPLSTPPREDVDGSTARSIASAPGWQLWAAIGDRAACVATHTPSTSTGSVGACAAAGAVIRHGLIVLSHPSPKEIRRNDLNASVVEVSGLVPDGTRQIAFTLRSGNVVEVPVSGNGFAARLPDEPVADAFASGSTRVGDAIGSR